MRPSATPERPRRWWWQWRQKRLDRQWDQLLAELREWAAHEDPSLRFYEAEH